MFWILTRFFCHEDFFFLKKKIKEQLEIDLPFVSLFAVSWKGVGCAEIGLCLLKIVNQDN